LVAGAVVDVVLAPSPPNKLDPPCCCAVFVVLPKRLVPLCCCVFVVLPNKLDPLCCCVVFVFPNKLVVGFDVFPKKLPDDVDGAPEVAEPLSITSMSALVSCFSHCRFCCAVLLHSSRCLIKAKQNNSRT